MFSAVRPPLASLLLAAAFAGVPVAAAAQAGADGTPLPAITVTSTRTERRTDEVPNTVTVVPAEQIEQSGARDIKDVFRDEIDVTVRRQPARFTPSGGSARAGNEGINIRGLEGNQVLMLVDGIRVPNSFAFGQIGTGRGDFLNIDSARSIEVLRGPASTQYGSDGLAGVLSLRTLAPEDVLKGDRRAGGFIGGGYASVDRSVNGRLGLAARGGAWRALLLLSGRRGHETGNQGANDSLDANRTTPNPFTYSTPSALGKLIYSLDARNEFGLTLESQQRRQDTEVYSGRASAAARGVTTAITDLQAHDKLERQRVSLEHDYRDTSARWLQRAHTHLYAQDAGTHQFTLAERSINGAPAAAQTRDYEYRQKIVGLSSALESLFETPALGRGSYAKLSYGLDASRSEVRGQFTGVTPPKLFPDTGYLLAGAFAQAEIDWGGFTLFPGLRLDRYKLDADPSGYGGAVVSLSDQAVTPRLGAIWRLAPTFAPYLNLARGFRAPTPDQVNNGFGNPAQGYLSIGNPNLKAERAASIELGFRGAAGGFRYQLLGYDNRYRDFISQQVVSGRGIPGVDPLVFQYVNLSKARIRGLEARTEWQPGGGWFLNAGVASSRGWSEAAGVETPLDTVEPLRAVLGARLVRGAWEWRGSVLHAAAKSRGRISDPAFYAPPGYTVLNLGLSWKPGKSVTLSANVFNVTDRKYWRWSDVRGIEAASPVLDAYTAPGRNAQVALRYDF